jgi:uncharacterized protein (DUF58 family)
MVKTFDEELSGRITFIFDCGDPSQSAGLDNCLRAAGSLMFAALATGHHVNAIDLGSLSPVLVPPFDDGEELLDVLARLVPQTGTLTLPRLREAVFRATRRSALCLVLTGFNREVALTIEQALARRHPVSLYLPDGCPSNGAPPTTPIFRYRENEILEPV